MNTAENNVTDFRASLVNALNDRKAYELAKNVDNSNMQKTLSDLIKSIDHDAIASALIACNYDASRITAQNRVNAKTNVYALEKDVNAARFIANVPCALNHYTLNVFLSAVSLRKADKTLTHEDARSACSLSVKVKDAAREALLSKYQKHVAENTASTQSSSSISTLKAFQVLRETRDAANVTCYTLNVDSEATRKLAEKLNVQLDAAPQNEAQSESEATPQNETKKARKRK